MVDLCFPDEEEEEELWCSLKQTILIHIRDLEGEQGLIEVYNEAKEELEKVRIKNLKDRQEKIKKIIKKEFQYQQQRSMKSRRLITSLQRKQYPQQKGVRRCVYG